MTSAALRAFGKGDALASATAVTARGTAVTGRRSTTRAIGTVRKPFELARRAALPVVVTESTQNARKGERSGSASFDFGKDQRKFWHRNDHGFAYGCPMLGQAVEPRAAKRPPRRCLAATSTLFACFNVCPFRLHREASADQHRADLNRAGP